jgi:hypothetical protein
VGQWLKNCASHRDQRNKSGAKTPENCDLVRGGPWLAEQGKLEAFGKLSRQRLPMSLVVKLG